MLRSEVLSERQGQDLQAGVEMIVDGIWFKGVGVVRGFEGWDCSLEVFRCFIYGE